MIALARSVAQEGVEIGVADAVAVGFYLGKVDAEVFGALADRGGGEDLLPLPLWEREGAAGGGGRVRGSAGRDGRGVPLTLPTR
jgi:hypothetical protein